jgi:hypothetical protein
MHDDDNTQNGPDKFRLANDIQRYLQVHRGLHEIAERLMHVSDLEAAAAEQQQVLQAQDAHLAELKAEQTKAEARTNELTLKHAEMTRQAHAEVQRVKDEGKADAQRQSERLRARHAAEEEKLRATEHQTRAAVAAHEDAHKKLQQTIAERERHEQYIRDLKGKIGLIGG